MFSNLRLNPPFQHDLHCISPALFPVWLVASTADRVFHDSVRPGYSVCCSCCSGCRARPPRPTAPVQRQVCGQQVHGV